ncbi:MAG: carbohydrate ABC transporter permease [Nitrososphaeria archaeon]
MKADISPYIVLAILASILLSPIVLITFNSFKNTAETFGWPPTIIPKEFSLEAYEDVINSYVPLTLRNSLIISVGTMVVVLLFSIFTAYGISKYKFKGSRQISFLILTTRIIPPLSLIVPFYILMGWLKLTDTFLCIIILETYMNYPLMVWTLKGFFDDFPQDLIDSALVDGCSRTRAFLRVVLPVSAVSLAAAAIITFLWTWNEFIYAIIFLSTPDVQPITVGIFQFVGDEVIEWNSLSAVSVFTSIPAIIFFVVAQKYIVSGLLKGAVKR